LHDKNDAVLDVPGAIKILANWRAGDVQSTVFVISTENRARRARKFPRLPVKGAAARSAALAAGGGSTLMEFLNVCNHASNVGGGGALWSPDPFLESQDGGVHLWGT
jgi:hypothetical protein